MRHPRQQRAAADDDRIRLVDETDRIVCAGKHDAAVTLAPEVGADNRRDEVVAEVAATVVADETDG